MKRIPVVMMLCASTALAASDDEMGRRVQELLHAHQQEVFGCVAAASASGGAKAEGEMLVRVRVGEGGKAAEADVLKDQSNGGPLGGCLTGKIKSWDLAPLQAAAGDQVVFPLVFKPEKLHKGEKRVLVPMAAQETAGPQRFLVDEETIGEPPLATLDLLTLAGNQSTPLKTRPEDEEELVLYVLDGGFKLGAETLVAGDVLWLGAHTDRPALQPLDKKPLKLLEVRAHGAGTGQKVVHGAALKTYPIAGGGAATARLLLDGTGAKLAVDEIEADVGTSIPSHKHSAQDEELYFLGGRSVTTVGKTAYDTAPGDALRISANTAHTLKVTEKLRAIQVYAPSGPEQRFKGASGGEEVPGKKKRK
jgi:quercetin dioxygenase-like cupin family protein